MADQDPDEPTDFEARLKAAREKAEDNSGPVPSRLQYESSSAGLGFRMGIELMVGVVVGLGIGWLLDGWLAARTTSPFAFVQVASNAIGPRT